MVVLRLLGKYFFDTFSIHNLPWCHHCGEVMLSHETAACTLQDKNQDANCGQPCYISFSMYILGIRSWQSFMERKGFQGYHMEIVRG